VSARSTASDSGAAALGAAGLLILAWMLWQVR